MHPNRDERETALSNTIPNIMKNGRPVCWKQRKNVTFPPDVEKSDTPRTPSNAVADKKYQQNQTRIPLSDAPVYSKIVTSTISDSTWYTRKELKTIRNTNKDEAKKYSTLLSSEGHISSSQMSSSLVLPFKNCEVYKKMKVLVKIQAIINEGAGKVKHSKDQHEFRGLEHQIMTERHRNKNMALNTVMKYQRRTQALIDDAVMKGTSESQIATMKDQFAKRLSTIYSQLSQWSKDAALAAAIFDDKGVYSLSVRPRHCEDSSGIRDEQGKESRNVHKRRRSKTALDIKLLEREKPSNCIKRNKRKAHFFNVKSKAKICFGKLKGLLQDKQCRGLNI